MEDTLTLDRIAYRSIYDYTAFFLGQLKGKTKEEFELLIRRVKSQMPQIKEMMYAFDDSLWPSDEPTWHNNLIRFTVRLNNRMDYLTIRMAVDRGVDQELVSAPLPTTKWYGDNNIYCDHKEQ